MLKIQNGELGDAEAAGVAERVRDLLSRRREDLGLDLNLLALSIRTGRCGRGALEKLLVDLHRGLSPGTFEHDYWIMSAMDGLVGRRRSGLEDPRIRASLNLPLVAVAGAD